MKPEELLPPEFRSGNDVPVERATITRSRMIGIIEEWNRRARQVGQVDKSSNQQGYEVDKTPEKQDQPAKPVRKKRPETTAEHIARDMREGRFPNKSDPIQVLVEPVSVPSDSEIMWEWANTKNTGDMRVDLTVFARALLAKYAK